MQSFLGHSWQLVKVTSVGNIMPEIDFLGIIRKLSVNLTPIFVSTSPKIENNSLCWAMGQSSCPGPICDTLPSLYLSTRHFSRYVLADESARSPILSRHSPCMMFLHVEASFSKAFPIVMMYGKMRCTLSKFFARTRLLKVIPSISKTCSVRLVMYAVV